MFQIRLVLETYFTNAVSAGKNSESPTQVIVAKILLKCLRCTSMKLII